MAEISLCLETTSSAMVPKVGVETLWGVTRQWWEGRDMCPKIKNNDQFHILFLIARIKAETGVKDNIKLWKQIFF